MGLMSKKEHAKSMIKYFERQRETYKLILNPGIRKQKVDYANQQIEHWKKKVEEYND